LGAQTSYASVYALSAADIERWIRGAGFEPRRRNMRYELLPNVSEAEAFRGASAGRAV